MGHESYYRTGDPEKQALAAQRAAAEKQGGVPAFDAAAKAKKEEGQKFSHTEGAPWAQYLPEAMAFLRKTKERNMPSAQEIAKMRAQGMTMDEIVAQRKEQLGKTQ